MKPNARPLTSDEIGILIGLMAIVLGAGLYLYPPMLAGFPINDGGLFYTMIRAIQANGFRLPDYVQYNGLNIPFVYPPLGFYVGAALSSLLHLDPILILQWFPSLTLIGISIAFYFLAARILGSRLEAGIATFLYVCTPRSMTWLVMGGGLTRGLGQLLLMLTVMSVFSLFTDGRRRYLLLSILFSALVIVTHPEALVQTAATCILLWLWKGRNRQGTFHALQVALGALILSSAWWLPKVIEFGTGPFVSAAQTGLQTSVILIYPLLFTFTEEPTLALIAALGLIGLAASLLKREYFLPAWLLLPFLIEPRSAATVAIIPLALMAAIAIREVLDPAFRKLAASSGPPQTAASLARAHALYWVAAYISLFLLVMATYASLQLAQVRLQTADREAFAWVEANAAPDSRFLILTGETELFCDPVQEWFPALTGRSSLTTIQGYEWKSDGTFFSRVTQLQDLQRCVAAAEPLECVQQTAKAARLDFDYVYIQKQATSRQLCRVTGGAASTGGAIIAELERDRRFSPIYESDAAGIFAVQSGSAFMTAENTNMKVTSQVNDSTSKK